MVTGALGASITSPYAGLAIAVAVAAGLTVRSLRVVASVATVGLLAAAAALVVAGQMLHPAAGGGGWPAEYAGAASLAAIAVAFLGADAVVDYATAPPPARTSPPGHTSSPAHTSPPAHTSAPDDVE